MSLRAGVLVGLICLLVGAFGFHSYQNASQWKAQRDSLAARVATFDAHQAVRVRVDTIRAVHVVRLASHADTIIQRIRETSHDTVTLARVDTIRTDYSIALALDSTRIAFWKASYDTTKSERDDARRLLAQAHAPGWTLATTFDTGLRVNVCALRPVTRILGLDVSVGVCYRS